ncbi:MAG: hypothetical protein GY844_31440 [Bradyrhizobium sp.]|jgi:hypothetical protein|uniref:hypothetical protein n=1 Tax=unclassified Sphingomonas TaxID=196159 RepID=UPI0010F4D7F6|nr:MULTISPECIES: hypothetical protein [unclassified Sphingomonas]MCP4620946.1 hypothetical protein [Bradyrhizobium sp.]NWN33376.1 hypothetical protein [Klebsiella michiganensis]
MSRALAIVAFGRPADRVIRELGLEIDAPCSAVAPTPYDKLSAIDRGMWVANLRPTARAGGRPNRWSAE